MAVPTDATTATEATATGWRRLRFGQKLGIAFGALLVLIAVTAGVALHGMGRVQAGYDQALGFGARLGQQMALARGQFQELRRRESEFLLRSPEVGIIQARDTWLQRKATVQQDDTLPEDARTTAAAALAELRATLAGMVALLERAERELALGALRGEIGQLRDAARAALSDTSAHRQRLDKVVRLLEERGDSRTVVPPLPLPITPAADEAARAAELARPGQTAALARALAGVGLPDPTTEELALREAVERVAARAEWGLPYRPSPRGEEPDAVPPSACGTPAMDEDTALDDGYLAAFRALKRLAFGSGVRPLPMLLALQRLRTTDRAVQRELRALHCQSLALERRLDAFAELGPKAVATLTQEAEVEATGASATVLLIAILCFVLGGILAWWLGNQIRVPVRELADTAKQVAAGDLNAEAWVYTRDEIGDLATTFNAMTARLKAQNERIQAQMQEIAAERDRSEQLLLNVLPMPIAERLKGKEHPIADAFAEASVLFADVVGYTSLSAQMDPRDVVACLSRIFSAFDAIAQRHGVEKIKTIGDAYMAACGLPRHCDDHPQRIADMALDMQAALAAVNQELPVTLQLRIGLNCGPVVAGVIGEHKFIYDLWGDAVNVASRMESHGVPGAIQLPAAMAERLRETHVCEPRGVIEVKGKGKMETCLLVGRKAQSAV